MILWSDHASQAKNESATRNLSVNFFFGSFRSEAFSDSLLRVEAGRSVARHYNSVMLCVTGGKDD
jgi:hypothetical protein